MTLYNLLFIPLVPVDDNSLSISRRLLWLLISRGVKVIPVPDEVVIECELIPLNPWSRGDMGRGGE